MPAETIKDRGQIIEHLDRLIQGRIHVTASFGDMKQEYLSQPLALEEAGRGRPSLVLDGLVPPLGQRRVAREKMLRVAYRWGDDPWRFDAVVREVRETPFPAVVVAVPTQIEPNQLRQNFRVDPSIDSPVRIEEIEVPTADDEASVLGRRCSVVDISVGGLSFNTDIPRSHFDVGRVLPKVLFRLPDGPRLACKAIVRSIRPSPSPHYRHRIGLEFLGLDRAGREAINHYVVEKQRSDIRHFKREFE